MSIQSVNPATGETLETFEETSPQELERSLAAAAAAFHEWRGVGFTTRAQKMREAARVLRARAGDYARTMTLEMGKPIVQAEAEIDKCAVACEYYADHAEAMLAPQPRQTDAARSYVRFDPLGPVLAIMPWNFPFWQVFRFAAPALMAGNAGILKHASNVPRTALAIQDIFREAGFPRGLFSTVLVGSAAVPRLIADPRIVAATLTGSDLAGRKVAEQAGRALKKTVLELGGSDPFLVLADADLDAASAVAVRARNQNNGQSCIAAKRFIVEEPVADEFERRFTAAVAALKVGNPMDRANHVGPLARGDLVDELERQVNESVRLGARTLTGGKRIGGDGYYFEPTVLSNVRPGMPAYHEETFGPVAAVIRVKDAEDALRVANDTDFGLGSAIWTADIERAKQLGG